VRRGSRGTPAATPGTWRENSSCGASMRDPMMRRERAALAGHVVPLDDDGDARTNGIGPELPGAAARAVVRHVDGNHPPQKPTRFINCHDANRSPASARLCLGLSDTCPSHATDVRMPPS
jgi:hypothetical protein